MYGISSVRFGGAEAAAMTVGEKGALVPGLLVMGAAYISSLLLKKAKISTPVTLPARYSPSTYPDKQFYDYQTSGQHRVSPVRFGSAEALAAGAGAMFANEKGALVPGLLALGAAGVGTLLYNKSKALRLPANASAGHSPCTSPYRQYNYYQTPGIRL